MVIQAFVAYLKGEAQCSPSRAQENIRVTIWDSMWSRFGNHIHGEKKTVIQIFTILSLYILYAL